MNDEKFLLDTSTINIENFAHKLFEYEHGYYLATPAGLYSWTSIGYGFPDQVREMYLTKALRLLEWIDENKVVAEDKKL